ncbi:hypothetical protein CFP56_035045 [Quercus suber]|uniref:Uncharacterized protein n=1 Tax=Quercus suber TaxID=58331 RepID=A0AAW0JAK3_QUESU
MASSTSAVASAFHKASTTPIDFVQRLKRTTPVELAASFSLTPIFNASVSSNFISSAESPKTMVDMNAITKPPWPDPLSQAPPQDTVKATASHLTKPLSSLSSPLSLAIAANAKLLVFSVDRGGSSSLSSGLEQKQGTSIQQERIE